MGRVTFGTTLYEKTKSKTTKTTMPLFVRVPEVKPTLFFLFRFDFSFRLR